MKRLHVAAAALIALSSPTIASAEQDRSVTVDTSVAVLTDYMFRGFNLYDGTSIQPSTNLNYKTEVGTFTGGLWFHLPGEGDRQSEKFTELDATLKYAHSIGPVAFTIGNVWYTYPNEGDNEILDTAEMFATVSYDTLFTPTLSFYHDWDEFDAQYYEFGLSHKLTAETLGEGFNVTPFVAFGFASSADNVYDDDGLVHVTYGMYSTVSLGDITLTPSVNYTSKVDDATVNEFWAGISFAYSF